MKFGNLLKIMKIVILFQISEELKALNDLSI